MPAKICPGLMDGRSQGGPASDEVKEQMGCPHGQSQRQERLREAAEELEAAQVEAARKAGATWIEIGACYGLTKQGAQQRFRTARNQATAAAAAPGSNT